MENDRREQEEQNQDNQGEHWRQDLGYWDEGKLRVTANYVENIDDWTEAELEEGLDEGANHWTPYHAFDDPFGYSFVPVALKTESEEQSKENKNSHQHPEGEEDAWVVEQSHWLIPCLTKCLPSS